MDETGEKTTAADLRRSLQYLSEYLRKASGKKAVVLINEYDVPLENAYRNGFYRKMVDVIGPMLQNVLKTNSDNLQFAVVTGCLRIAKEGIYTGLNNPEINTVDSDAGSDAIGFILRWGTIFISKIKICFAISANVLVTLQKVSKEIAGNLGSSVRIVGRN